jgi:BlaI family transcriptional regulator, penicillinase repressor
MRAVNRPPSISDAEWQVMEAIWREHPVAASEVIANLGGKSGWKPNTVRTLLARLVKKGALEFSQDGNRYLYAPRFTREEHVSSASESFLDRIFGGTARSLLIHFAESGKVTERDIAELKRILDQPRK